ncbi:hypothetical protein DP939_10135 [Spongiactinospora rosea]|uniref:Uncharacterized protein n=1 Tax=Spongiactinospora rosea TaxID=2248750 RepID=A0A366M1S2_9ACTN|nr:hypothetical protein [Spongiactinospora rosea]RBQ20168.1 hypothetical protein DP939_10135 [Spongiactinospora rosea]
MKTFPSRAALAVPLGALLLALLASPASAHGALAAPEGGGGLPVWVWILAGGLAGVGIGLFLSLRGKSGKKR